MQSPGSAAVQAPATLWTIGHSTREWPVFVGMLRDAGIATLADVRRFAGSRRHPQYVATAMQPALYEAGIEYVAMPALGGRRAPVPGSSNGAWRVAAFRGYADYMATADFARARARLVRLAGDTRCAVMCAEALWWQCHRRLIADDFLARGWQVTHLMAPGRSEPHVLHEAARLVDGVLRYPAPGDAQGALF
ncbi:DUF488 family protein [Luteimonas aquatica]|uniref:DUF488 domain-containing protein n=1 Tax=Luteimonas aquatica TaxID=450364 RepID=UPI001F57E5D9|nr:DUF488 domain-containing protein [Luteimonas aquatica]